MNASRSDLAAEPAATGDLLDSVFCFFKAARCIEQGTSVAEHSAEVLMRLSRVDAPGQCREAEEPAAKSRSTLRKEAVVSSSAKASSGIVAARFGESGRKRTVSR